MTLRLRGITKHYGSLRANDAVDLDVADGELHGLLGENGAGKSTLMKVLSGFVHADAGEVELDDEPLSLSSPRDAIAAGIGMLHQDPLVFGPFTVLDNFLLASPGTTRLDRTQGREQLAAAAQRYGFTFDPDAVARTLSVGERQQLEIARLLWLGARLLIFDEPTTGISAEQRDKLFEVLRDLAGDGLIVIFVSHKLEEIEQLCNRVTIMRAGKVVGTEDMPVPAERLVELMFGDVIVVPDRPPATLGQNVLRVREAEFSDRIDVGPVDVDVAESEVLGLAGLEGSGQRTFLRGCAGLIDADRGSIRVDGVELAKRHHDAFRSAGVHLLPAGRLEEGLVPGLTIAEHFELVSANRSFFVDWGEAEATARRRIASDSIKGTIASTAESLSGGNQQRLLLAMLPRHVRLLLMEHPTRGLDFESAAWVWTQLLERRIDGTAIVFASVDLDELLRYSDRIAVFFAGRIIEVVDAQATDAEELGHLIGGRRR
jgi:general nucleoside transport system ATP-binding protein